MKKLRSGLGKNLCLWKDDGLQEWVDGGIPRHRDMEDGPRSVTVENLGERHAVPHRLSMSE